MNKYEIEREAKEKKHMEYWVKKKSKFLMITAFVARPNKGRGADRSCVLIGHKSWGWSQAIKFWHDDHKERADKFVKFFNSK